MSEEKSVAIYPPYFYNYIRLVENEALNAVLRNQVTQAENFFRSIPPEKWMYKYAEDKWTIMEVLQHITDTERVFSFRALAFSRRDPNTFPSFNENNYSKNSNAGGRRWQEMVEELIAVRTSTEFLFHSFSEDQLNAVGKASNYEMSVNAIGYMIAGHLAHHMNILQERYLADHT